MAERFTGAGLAAKPTINLSSDGGTVVGTTQLDGSQQINLVAGSGIILTGTSPDSITIQSTGGGGGGSVTAVTTTLSGITITNPTTTPEISGTLGVSSGGTGTTTLTSGGILLGSGAGAITTTAQPTDGQLLIGSTGTDPVLATLSAGSGISITEGAGSITIASTGVISGSGTAQQVTFWDGAASVTGDAAFTFNSTTATLDLEGDLQIRDSTIVQGEHTVPAGTQGQLTVFDEIRSNDFRSCKYVVQISDSTAGDYQLTELLVLNPNIGTGTTAGDVVEYGSVYGGISGGSQLGINFNSTISNPGTSNATIKVFFTVNTNNAITVDFVRTLLFQA